MSAQFGRWNFDGTPAPRDCIEKVRSLLDPYGPDGAGHWSRRGVELLFHSFDTVGDIETQPYSTASGMVLMWDGRLDNREELLHEMDGKLSPNASDVDLVAGMYDDAGIGAFKRLIGDWALSVWNPQSQTLTLARDFLGARRLYYSIGTNQVVWSTVLDPLVLLAAGTLALDHEYIAGWLSSYPAAHRTPFAGIRAVPPACFVTLPRKKLTITQYWRFDGDKRIRYREDSEYEEHFRAVFAQSVRHRLRSSFPILAELSGGMDSSSIVCMADRLMSSQRDGTPQIDTISYFDDAEPHWDEQPYFSKVEEMRGRKGLHVRAGSEERQEVDFDSTAIPLWPGSARAFKTQSPTAEWMRQNGHRVLLCGIGGDEILGGKPTPVPELEDLLAEGKFRTLARQLRTWALVQRRPWFYLLRDAVAGFLPAGLMDKQHPPAAWIDPAFAESHREAFLNYRSRWKLFGPLPSFQENLGALDALRRQLAATELHAGYPYEKRYPYLDRDLVEFAYAIPREQMVRPGQRRSLMRRALRDIVPAEIIERRRKAYATRSPIRTVLALHEKIRARGGEMISASLGIVNPRKFGDAIDDARNGKDVAIIPLLRTLGLELWLRGLDSHGALHGSAVDIASSNAVYVDFTQPELAGGPLSDSITA
jgi:asparagine synthase (glutamine-hydrolysing)